MADEQELVINYVGTWKGEEIHLTIDEYDKLLTLIIDKQNGIDEDIAFFHYSVIPDIKIEMGEDEWDKLSNEEQTEWFEERYINSITISDIIDELIRDLPKDFSEEYSQGMTIQEKVLLGIDDVDPFEDQPPRGEYDDVFIFYERVDIDLFSEVKIRQKIKDIIEEIEQNKERKLREEEEKERIRITERKRIQDEIERQIDCLGIQLFISAIKKGKTSTVIDIFRENLRDPINQENIDDILNVAFRLIKLESIDAIPINYSYKIDKLIRCWREYYSILNVYPPATILFQKIDQPPFGWPDLDYAMFKLASQGYEVLGNVLFSSSINKVFNSLLNHSPDVLVLYYDKNVGTLNQLIELIDDAGLCDRLKTLIVEPCPRKLLLNDREDIVQIFGPEARGTKINDQVLLSLKNLLPFPQNHSN